MSLPIDSPRGPHIAIERVTPTIDGPLRRAVSDLLEGGYESDEAFDVELAETIDSFAGTGGDGRAGSRTVAATSWLVTEALPSACAAVPDAPTIRATVDLANEGSALWFAEQIGGILADVPTRRRAAGQWIIGSGIKGAAELAFQYTPRSSDGITASHDEALRTIASEIFGVLWGMAVPTETLEFGDPRSPLRLTVSPVGAGLRPSFLKLLRTMGPR